MPSLLFKIMTPSIKFNSKANIVAVEVNNISTHRILATKLVAAETPPSQDVPEEYFSICLIFSKLSCENEHIRRNWHSCPLTLALSLMERG